MSVVVSCTQCQAKFKVDDSKIGPRGVKVRCIKCQTMIIVKPPGAAEPITQPTALASEVPTRVLTLDPNARAQLTEAAKSAEPPTRVMAVGGSFGLDPAPAPPGVQPSLPPLPAFSNEDPTEAPEPTMIAPPPRPGPPPLKKPALAEPGEDLFASPFGKPGELGTEDRFLEAGGAGPSLELDSRKAPEPPEEASPPTAPTSLPAPPPDPLADLPRFAQSDEPLLPGAPPPEGTVTKPHSLAQLEADTKASQAVPQTVNVQDEKTVAKKLPKVSTPKEKKTPRSILARVAQVVMAAVILSGYAGLYLLWQAGGLEAFSGKSQSVEVGMLSIQHVSVAPFVAADGSAFWVVRGEAFNRGTATLNAVQINVTLDGHTPVSVPVGVEPDAAKLYAANTVVMPGAPADLPPEHRLPFAAVVRAAQGSAAPPRAQVAPIFAN